ncbi:MAG: formate dehydrogenase subunit alpha [Anaerolineales bacterium]|nr:formate dehydrogenase subunit alpha [Anaerolineales bacterium]
MTVNLTIDGVTIEAQEGQTILDAAREHGIHIPTLCYHRDLTPTGNCRICVVDIIGQRFLQAACVAAVGEGMEVKTNSARVVKSRRKTLEMMLANHPPDCLVCDSSGACELQDLAYEYQVRVPEWGSKGTRYPVDSDPNPFVRVDFNKCILCRRCVQACEEIQGRFVWGVAFRGLEERIVAGADTTMLEARCESCGQCVAYCPTGALSDRMSYGLGRAHQIKKVTTTCTYCGVGCQFDLNVKDGRIIGVTSNPAAPVNGMALCVKGRYGYDFVHHPDRLTRPKVRQYLLDGTSRPKDRGAWVEVDWDTALKITADRLRSIRDTYGSESIGVLTSAKCLNEENYLMNKFARQVLGTNNVDHCARLCHASTVAGLAISYGSGAMSNTMEDVTRDSQAMLIIGSNTSEQHPVFGTKIRQAVRRRGLKLVVADPRRIDMVEFAVLHLRHRSGTDIALLNGLMHIILQKGWEDKEFIANRTEGFEEYRASIENYPPQLVSETTGVPVEQLYQAAEILATNKPMAVVWAMGITQHTVGVRNVMDLANLQMLLGNMGIAGGGVNPLRGQNNVQGACDMGGLPNVYPGYQPVTSEAARQKFEAAWGVALPDQVGQTVTTMIPAAGEGGIKALYIMAEDPVMSDPDSNHIRHCLETCEFMVLQDIFPTETSPYADVLLPGVSFAEKTGTFTNTERRVQMVRQAIQPAGSARPDWWITARLAGLVLSQGLRQVGSGAYAGWEYENTAQVMAEVAALTPSYAGVSHERLERGDALHWPVKDANHPGTPILHIGQFTRGLGKFMPIEHVPPAECPDNDYPFLLNTGRVLYHWHGGELTRRAKGLLAVYDRPLVEINPEDADRIGLDGKKRVRVTSRRGSLEAEAWVTDRVPPGMIFANFHFPEACANELTIAALDPVALIPEYKVCAVKVELI